jgi:CubicO group peptidase (beta-lactamase class C family)
MIICPVRSVVDDTMEVILAGYWADKYMSKSNIGLNHAPIASIDFGPRRRRLTHDGPVYDVAHGHWDTRFDQVADALAEEIATGAELGATIAVDIDGELVVDIWGGHADRAKTVPWGKDTIVNFFSCTKTLTALASLILVDRGLLDPFAPVAKYWPEFAENGKQNVEVRHLMAHASGVSGWELPFDIEDMYDWDKPPRPSGAVVATRHRVRVSRR